VRICYVLLSPTFGMHQYTADLANRLVGDDHDVHLVTTSGAPRDRYTSQVTLHTPVATSNTGFSGESLRIRAVRRVVKTVLDLKPDVVHFSGPHMWNLPLAKMLKAKGVPVTHSIHDLDPHIGSGYGFLLRIWNYLILRSVDHILVHGETYRDRLLAQGIGPEQITLTPLLHLFVGGAWLEMYSDLAAATEYQPWALFFGRLKRYKGLEYLLTACAMMDGANNTRGRIVVAGNGDISSLWAGSLPDRLALHNGLINDEEAMDLFSRCGLLVLPYTDATQSALIAAAYYFRKAVIVTRTGALPEYVVDGETGYIIEPDHPAALARVLVELLDDPQALRRMGEAGRAWYDERRSEEQEALLHMYRGLMTSRPERDGVGTQGLAEGDYGYQ